MCVLAVATYGLETMALTKQSENRLRVTERSMERMSLRDKVRNEVIRWKTKVVDGIERIS